MRQKFAVKSSAASPEKCFHLCRLKRLKATTLKIFLLRKGLEKLHVLFSGLVEKVGVRVVIAEWYSWRPSKE